MSYVRPPHSYPDARRCSSRGKQQCAVGRRFSQTSLNAHRITISSVNATAPAARSSLSRAASPHGPRLAVRSPTYGPRRASAARRSRAEERGSAPGHRRTVAAAPQTPWRGGCWSRPRQDAVGSARWAGAGWRRPIFLCRGAARRNAELRAVYGLSPWRGRTRRCTGLLDGAHPCPQDRAPS